MGCSSSSSATVQLQVPGEQTESRYWHKVLVPSDSVESSSSGEVDRTEVELRALLDYPIGRQFLLDEIRSSGFPPFVDLCLQAWLDIQSFNGMIPSRTQTTMGLSIHRKHIQKNTLVNEAMKQSISPLVKDHRLIVSGIFDQAQALFFKLLHDQMFVQFKGSSQYPVMCATLRRKYNRVKEKDFMYHQMIGQGGFGLVCEVSKKSTGARYAMKLQRKVHMFDRFAAEPWRADIEKRAFASCKHPFIVELFFAFHTESMAVMVTSLGTGRDLSKVLRGAGPLTIEQVRFYAAEITSALSYLHDKGLVYRDLKPGNVLLNMDGHIQLIDFGGVVDINGNTLGKLFVRCVFCCCSALSCSVHCNYISNVHFWVVNSYAGICKDATAMSRVLLDSKTKEAPSLPLTRFWTESTSKSLEGAGDPSSSAPSTLEDYGGIQAHRMEGEGWSPGENNVLTDSSAGPDCNALMKQCTTPAVTFMLLRKKFYELSAATVLRHLVACNGDVDKSTTHLEAYMLWREKQFTSTVRPSHQTVGAGCVLFTHGYDSAGHPLVIFTTRLQNMKTRNLDEMVRWCLYIFEEAISRLPPHLEQMTILVNRHGMTQGADFELSKHLFPLLDKYYPHRIHKILLFPVAIYLRGIFGLVKRIAGKSAENLVLVKSINALRNEIPDKYIPFELGGTCEYEFSIDDFPPPVVCEPYEFTKARVDEISVCPFSSKSSSGEADLSINQDSLLPESMSEIANLPRANSIVGTYSYMVS